MLTSLRVVFESLHAQLLLCHCVALLIGKASMPTDV